MSAKNPSAAAEQVRASVIRRPTGAAAAPLGAAAAFQGSAAPESEVTVRTTMQLSPEQRTALKRAALDANTTMSAVIRQNVEAAFANPPEFAARSLEYRRVAAAARTSLDLPRDLHRRLKMLAADRQTSVQALLIAANSHVIHP